MYESDFEQQLIEYITTGTITPPEELQTILLDRNLDKPIKTRLWTYEPHIKTTEDLWANFKSILEQHNADTLRYPLSVQEFSQVKKAISDLNTPYDAGRFLYGMNGVSQIEVDLDDGRHVFLDVFDQDQIGGGDTVYQVVNQIERPAVITGKKDRRFDVTLLINGLPMVQIELKKNGIDVSEALNQMEQYALENQYSDIFSTLQILVGMTPNDAKYMANVKPGFFNKDFAFRWQTRKDNKPVREWKSFADHMLSIPMAHQMSTNYMILDGTPNRESLKIMRPYQVYATQHVIEEVKKYDFEMQDNRLGYIWHTTGSGKTITSFKTAWLASRLPGIDKVVFVVDRKALTQQTSEKYKAYDPDSDDNFSFGKIQDTENTTELSSKLKSKGNDIIVTSIQKLERLIKRKNFKAPDKHILFIVDEAHRSTGGDAFQAVQKAFKKAAWIGYTGTPTFDDQDSKTLTVDLFGPCRHSYTIREAIADRNVLGFKVDFHTTIDQESMKTKYLPDFYKELHPHWTQEQIDYQIEHMTPADMDDTLTPSFYDENEDHVKLVVEDIVKNWKNRSNDGRYNAILTTHRSGGQGSSVPMAMMYFQEFQKANQSRIEKGEEPLKVAVTFSYDTSNGNSMVSTNQSLEEAMKIYNQQFGTSFDATTTSEYFQDVMSRLNKTADDGQYLDLVIVIDQLLTGFDAPQLNTLYVDRTLKGANLIQAYSRTNRVENMQEKAFGNIVNYRWPAYNEKLMNKALAVYSNKNNQNLAMSQDPLFDDDPDNPILQKSFSKMVEEVKGTVEELRKLTSNFVQLPPSEAAKEQMLHLLQKYNAGMAKLKQYPPEVKDGVVQGFDYDHPDEILKFLSMTPEENDTLTTSLANELKEHISRTHNIPLAQVDLKMTYIKDIKVNYDYLTELLEKLLNEIHENKMEKAEETRSEIDKFANSMEDRKYARQIKRAAAAIISKEFNPAESGLTYPYRLSNTEDIVKNAHTLSLDRKYLIFRNTWGLTDIVTSPKIRYMIENHTFGSKDLDDAGELNAIIAEGAKRYKELALNDDVRGLSKIKYRNKLREAFYELADEEKREDAE